MNKLKLSDIKKLNKEDKEAYYKERKRYHNMKYYKSEKENKPELYNKRLVYEQNKYKNMTPEDKHSYIAYKTKSNKERYMRQKNNIINEPDKELNIYEPLKNTKGNIFTKKKKIK